MKKIIITVAILFGLATTNIANEVSIVDRLKTETVNKSQLQFINNERLGECLDLTKSDTVLVHKIYTDFCKNLSNSLQIEDTEKRDRKAVRAIRKTVVEMRKNLDDTNYRNFLRLLNLSMYDNNLLEISDKYCDKYSN